MAEGWARHWRASLGLSGVLIASAGIEAHGLNPSAIKVMQEVGIDISKQQSNVVDDVNLSAFGLVVTVCGDADERCPVLGTETGKLHWPLRDPAKLQGSTEEILNGFRLSRDDIGARVAELFKSVEINH